MMPRRAFASDWTIVFILAIGLLLRLVFLAIHFNEDWEPDGYNHVIMAKSVYADLPGSLWIIISVWGKPLYTWFFGTLFALLPASWPALVITQVANTLMWFVAGLLTLNIARDLFRQKGTLIVLSAIIAFTYVSFRASITANTEPMGALIFAFGLFYWHRGWIAVSLFAFGSVILIRTDGGFCVVVFAVAALLDTLRRRPVGWIIEFLVRGGSFALPLLVWNFVGYLRTGSALYVVSFGYPMSASGIYGFGNAFHFVREFLLFDTVLFVAFWAGVVMALSRPRTSPSSLLWSVVAGALYFVVMSAMWTFGAFGSAGLLRYFVVAYPAYILVAGLAVDMGLSWLQARGSPRWVGTAVVGMLTLVLVAQLHWLVREPTWHHNLLTRVPDNPIRALRTFALPWDRLDVYSDYPAVIYYAGKNSLYADAHPLSAVRDPNRRGIFVFTKGWSETYGGVAASDFVGMRPMAELAGPGGESLTVFLR